ncbi:MAG TPA: CpaD family pilus assembly protein [Sphingobium sp.]|nr:CpaD family pilus assembly protein [Sphingobium sp.]
MTSISAKTIVRIGALALLAMPLAACKTSVNRGVESVHQPVVSHTAFTYDVQAGPDGGLTAAEARRLDDWFASIQLGYGDQVAIVTDAYYSPQLRDGIADVVARHGMLVGEDSSAAAGAAPQGSVRLVVRRASARVPGCPDWSGKSETENQLGSSSNFGCGLNGNLAAMVANPDDLVRGQSSDSDLRTATSNRAISTYRDKAPTGSGDLKTLGR